MLWVSFGREHRLQTWEFWDCVLRGGASGKDMFEFDGTLKDRTRWFFPFSAIQSGRRSLGMTWETPGTPKLFLTLLFIMESCFETWWLSSWPSFSSVSSFSGRSPSFGTTLSFRLIRRSLVGLVDVGEVFPSLSDLLDGILQVVEFRFTSPGLCFARLFCRDEWLANMSDIRQSSSSGSRLTLLRIRNPLRLTPDKFPRFEKSEVMEFNKTLFFRLGSLSLAWACA